MRSKLAAAIAPRLARRPGLRPPPARPTTRPKAEGQLTRTTSRPIFQSRCNTCHNADKQKGGPEPRDLRRGDAGRRLGQGRRAGRPRRQHALPARHAQGRAEDAAERRPRSPTPRSSVIKHVDRGRGARDLGERGGGQGEAEVRVQARPLGDGQARRPAGDARGRLDRAGRRQPKAERRSSRWPPAPGRRWSPSAGTSRSCSTGRPTTTSSASCRSPRGRSTSSSSAATATCCWPAAAAAASRAWRSSGTSRPASGSSRSARNTTPSSPPTSAPTTARSPSAARARSSASTTRPTASSLFEMKKHTEWVTAVEFSPDGVLLATGDRNNGLVVWEAADRPRVLRPPRPHRGDHRHLLAARLERRRLVERGRHRPALGDGERQADQDASAPTAAASPRSGSPRTAGSSPPAATASVRLWDQNGNKQRDFEAFGDLALEAVFTHDDARVIAGDWSGEVRVWDAKDGRRLANLAANPAPIAVRLEQAQQGPGRRPGRGRRR